MDPQNVVATTKAALDSLVAGILPKVSDPQVPAITAMPMPHLLTRCFMKSKEEIERFLNICIGNTATDEADRQAIGDYISLKADELWAARQKALNPTTR